jgi:hypothetical protein
MRERENGENGDRFISQSLCMGRGVDGPETADQTLPAPNPYEAPFWQETDDLSERIFPGFSALFPGTVSVRARGLTSLPAIGADEVGCTNHVLRFYRHGDGACRETWSRLLRPRNLSVPSSRPPHKAGCRVAVRPFASGAGEGQHPSPFATIAAISGAGARVQSTAGSRA